MAAQVMSHLSVCLGSDLLLWFTVDRIGPVSEDGSRGLKDTDLIQIPRFHSSVDMRSQVWMANNPLGLLIGFHTVHRYRRL